MFASNTREIGLGATGESSDWLKAVSTAFTVGATSYLGIQQAKAQTKNQIAQMKYAQAQALANQTAAQKYSIMNTLTQSQAIVPIVLGVGAIGAFLYFRKRR